MSNLFIPENIVNMIVGEYKARIIGELKQNIERLDAKLTDGEVVFARRKALIDAINILEERNWYRAYNIASVPPLEERQYNE